MSLYIGAYVEVQAIFMHGDEVALPINIAASTLFWCGGRKRKQHRALVISEPLLLIP